MGDARLDQRQLRSAFAPGDKAIGAGGDRELFAAEQLANLPAGVVGPGTAIVEPDVGLPVAQSGRFWLERSYARARL